MKCPKCGKMFKGNRGLGVHHRHCEGRGKTEIAPKKRRTKKVTIKTLQEKVCILETRVQIAIEVLQGR